MKKKFIYLFTFSFLLFSVPQLIFAENNTDSAEHIDHSKLDGEPAHTIIYFVDSFDISTSNDTITLKGYSYISHQDNRGITEGKKENLTTALIAYVGDWDASYATCNNAEGGNCYKFKNQDYSGVDHFPLRCLRSACTTNNRSSLNNKAFSQLDQYGNTCFYGDSNCIYNNVGFKFVVDLVKMYNIMELEGKSGNLKFRIYAETTKHRDSVDLGVFSGMCKSDGQVCGSKIVTKNFDLDIADISTEAYMDAVSAYVQYENGESDLSRTWPDGKNYNIIGIGSPVTRTVHYGDFSLNTEGVRILHLSDGITDGWAYSTWVRIPGNLGIKLKLEPRTVEIGCDDVDSFASTNSQKAKSAVCGGNDTEYSQCMATTKSSIIYVQSSDNTSCTSYKQKMKDGNYYLKVKVSAKMLVNQVGVFKYPGLVSSDSLEGNSNKDVDSNMCYVSVNAGKGFTWQLDNNSNGGPVYINTVSWTNAVYKKADLSPYYTYKTVGGATSSVSGLVDFVVEDGKCVADSLKINDKTVLNSSGDSMGQGESGLQMASAAVIGDTLKQSLKTTGITDKTIESCDSNSDEVGCNFTNKNTGRWKTNSVDSASTVVAVQKVSGSSTYHIASLINGVNTTLQYQLGYSYLATWGDKSGNVYYKTKALDKNGDYYVSGGHKYIDGGRNYYVSFKAIPNSYMNFSFPTMNMSLISSMKNWNLSTKCYAKVLTGLYACTDDTCKDTAIDREACNPPDNPPPTPLKPNIIYRPIDVEDPFPLGNDYVKKVVNWHDWLQKSSNVQRLENTYDAYYNSEKPLYEIHLLNYGSTSTTGTLSISVMNRLKEVKNSDNYNSWANINTDGSSNFVNKYVTYHGRNSYCANGFFSTSCDQEWKG